MSETGQDEYEVFEAEIYQAPCKVWHDPDFNLTKIFAFGKRAVAIQHGKVQEPCPYSGIFDGSKLTTGYLAALEERTLPEDQAALETLIAKRMPQILEIAEKHQGTKGNEPLIRNLRAAYEHFNQVEY